ncbi:MAG: efflux RND transporter periplasmic adaptor subunit [Candidatus Binataceae bacterium]
MNARRSIAIAALIAAFASSCAKPADPAIVRGHPTVIVTQPQRGVAIRSISLPGDVVGFYESTLYSKVTGYLRKINVDKGDRVTAGEVLAEIEVPELQERVTRSRAALEVARLDYNRLDKVWKSDPRLVARQDVDIAQGKFLEAKAELDELEAMDSYTKITAPYAGVVTGRFVDPGALIKAGGSQSGSVSVPNEGSAHPGGSTTPVVSVAMIGKIRVYVYVPEDSVSLVRRGMPVTITVPDLPGRTFDASVTRFADSLDLQTRTMLTEIDLDNPARALYPGMYANVTLQLERRPNVLQLPDSAIGSGPHGSYVMVVRSGKLARQSVATGIRTAHLVEIKSGVKANDLVVKAFDPSLTAGERVTAVLKKDESHGPSRVAANNE